jgi:hypothetical protein
MKIVTNLPLKSKTFPMDKLSKRLIKAGGGGRGGRRGSNAPPHLLKIILLLV